MVIICDPQAAFQRVLTEKGDNPLYNPYERRYSLNHRAKHDNPGVLLRGVTAYVRKVEVQGDDRTILNLANRGKCGVSSPGQSLVVDAQGIVTGAAAGAPRFPREGFRRP
jgi:hypothetical protein